MRTVDAQPHHVPALLERMAPDEREQIETMTNGRGAALLIGNIRHSTLTWCGLDGDGVVTMGGIVPHAPSVGYLWQVITPAVTLHKRAYVLQGRDVVARALRQYPRLTTDIASSYRAALRHTRRLGFAASDPFDNGGTTVCRCTKEAF